MPPALPSRSARLHRCPWMLATAAVLAAAVPARAQESETPIFRQIIEAYQDISTYRATISFQQAERQGRWEISRRTTFVLAVDRVAGRLLVDTPEIRVVVDGTVLRAGGPQFQGRHLEIEVPHPLKYKQLIETVPILAQPMLPDLLMLLGEDPSKHDPNASIESVDPDPDDPEKLPGYMLATPQYRLIARYKPPRLLPLFTAVRWNPRVFNRPESDIMQAVHRIEIHTHNEPLDDAVFAFDINGSHAVSTMAELAGKHRLEGKNAPPMALETTDGSLFRLTESQHPIVLIGFWATWYPGWQRETEVLQRLHTWAIEEDMPLTVITVNVNDDADTVRAKAREAGLTAPVLLGTGKEVVKSYDATQLPRTVLVANGRIARIFEGLQPVEASLKQLIQQRKQAPAPQ